MKAFAPFLAFLAAVFALAFFAPRPSLSAPESRSLVMQPYLLRALSGSAHNLVGTFVWLKSRYADEITQGDQLDADFFAMIAKAQIILDPNFIAPARYSATYLASIAKRPSTAVDLITLSESLNPKRFDLFILEAILRATYDVPNSGDRLSEIARTIEAMPDKDKVLGSIVMDDWIVEMIGYVRSKEGRRDQVEADLLELLEQTENPHRRKLIEQELEKVRSQGNDCGN
ncbi:MAG: hypothetical protein LBN32_03370 [Helicobacteraceae bacterium]|jgi:hypothetical protein|nr:hypothetical protein [Helicobacteraceae bacterium]